MLRQWDPGRGLSLKNFVGLIAENEVMTILRSRRKSPWTEVPVDGEELDRGEDSTRGPERVAASREVLTAVVETIRAELSDLGLQLFELLFVEGRSVQEVCAATGKTEDAVYAWRSRIGRLAAKAAEEVMSGDRNGSRTRRSGP
jgi:RNA polymerase sigma-70 factor (ECF subfamily)